MDYSDLKSALSPLTGSLSWPAKPAERSYFYIVDPNKPNAQRPSMKISDLETALTTWLPNAPISALIKTLPTELQTFVTKLLADLEVSELGVATATARSGATPINCFNLVFEVDFSNPPRLGGIELDSVGLELNLMMIADTLVWSPTLVATCTFLGASCDLSVNLQSPVIKIMLSDSNSVTVDSILNSASSGTSLSTLQGNMCVSAPQGDIPKIGMFLATAEMSATPTFSCLLALSTKGWSWHKCDLTGIGIAFQHGGSSTSFSLAATITIGGVDANAMVSYETGTSNTTATARGAMSCQGVNLSDFLDQMATEIGFTNPLAGLLDTELSGIAFTITDTLGKVDFQMACDGAIAFDATGTSLDYTFTFDKSDTSEVSVSLQLGSLAFSLDHQDAAFVFSYSGTKTVSVSDLVQMARLYPLYGLADDVKLTLSRGVLAIMPGAGSSHHILCALDFSLNVQLDRDILEMITGGGKIGVTDATILAANQAWTPTELAAIKGSPITLTNPVPQGVSFLATLDIAGNLVSTSLEPPSANNSSTSIQAPAHGVQSPAAAKWFNVQKQIGPVYMDRIGLQLDTGSANGISINMLADASFLIGPMTISVGGFSITVPFESPSDFSVGLTGLNVSYDKPPMSISGGFLDQANELFIGDLEVQTETLFLSAIGEYAKNDSYASLALFAALTDPPLGGPVFCFVTGLAAGGGYNSSLKIPDKAELVATFPLIKAASSASPIGKPFQVIENCINPKQGEDWIAVGLIFRSFEFVQSTALLTATFGEKFQFAILGQSEMSIPPASSDRIAYAQVDIEARYIPSESALSVDGILTPNSYVLSQDCHIEGGFAYILKESGDFIVSYGGYASDYDYTSHGYPAVPRLQLVWNIDSHTSIKGSEYFALTPAAMMAGGALQATWTCGIFSAWFDVSVDVMIQWRPFNYKADFSMSLGVSFELKILFVHIHFTFHIGAQLSVAGPPFRGHAHIDLSVISFDVDFGPQGLPNPVLKWSEFRNMLPGNAKDDAIQSALLAVKVTDGLTKDLTQSGSNGDTATLVNAKAKQPKPDWVVNGTHFNFNIQSSLPVTQAAKGPVTVIEEPVSPPAIGILPMAQASAEGQLVIIITASDGSIVAASTDPTASVVVSAVTKDMASAHWGTEPPTSLNTPPVNCTTGYTLKGGMPVPDREAPVDLSILLAKVVQVTAISDRTASTSPFATHT